MYKILGADQNEYGPASEEIVRRWIAERRLDGRSRIRREGEPAWRALAEFPEFATALAEGSPVQPAVAVPAVPPVPGSDKVRTLGGGRKTSGTAIAALVIGLLAPCTVGLGGLIGIVLAVVALRRIKRSRGLLAGRGMAIAGLILSLLFLLTLPPLGFLAIRFQHQSRFQAFNPVADCTAHLQRLSEAVRRHANDNDDRFPPAATWCDAIQANVNGLDAFQCSARPDLRCGYALNAAAAGKTKFEVAPETVLLFESDAGWNASGDSASMIAASRHQGLFTVVLADGTVRNLGQGELSSLRWNP